MIVRNQQKYFHFDVYLQNIVASSNIKKFISAHRKRSHVDYMECLRSAQDFYENIDMAPSPTAIHLLYDGNVLSISSYPCQCVRLHINGLTLSISMTFYDRISALFFGLDNEIFVMPFEILRKSFE